MKKCYSLKIDEDIKIIFITFVETLQKPEEHEQVTAMLAEEVQKICRDNPQINFNICVDLSAIEIQSEHLPRSARQTYLRLMKHIDVDKVAIVYHRIFLKVVINLIVQAAGAKEHFKWFSQKKDAIAWICN